MKKTRYIIVLPCLLMSVSGCNVKREEISAKGVIYLQEAASADVEEAMSAVESAAEFKESVIRASEEASLEASRSAEESAAASIRESESVSREAKRASEEESRSIEHSIKEESRSIEQSIKDESESIEASIRQSEYDEAVEQSASEEAESIRQSIAEAESIEESIRQSEQYEAWLQASIEQSIEESRIIQESIDMSIAESVEASIAQSIAESEAARAAAEAAAKRLTSMTEYCGGTAIVPYAVVTATDAELKILWPLYKDTVVIGDSRVEGVPWVLDASRVFYVRGAHTTSDSMHQKVREAAALHPKKALFWMGLNDMGIFGADTAKFIAGYKGLIEEFLNANPGCKIYVQNMTPVGALGIANYSHAVNNEAYNAAIYAMCAECGYTFVDANTYFDQAYYGKDGLHYSRAYYRLWLQDVTNQMDLWGDNFK